MNVKQFFLIIFTFALASCETNIPDTNTTEQSTTDGREFYQLKVYTFKTDTQVSATDKYLKDAFLPGLKKQGINTVGVFKLKTNESDTIQKTFVLIPFSSLEQFLRHEDELNQDEAYLAAGSDYINASYKEPPYLRIESTLMKAFPDMPMMQASKVDAPRSERIYELRSYESATERYYKTKVDMFNAGGEIKLFDRLGFNAVFYAEVLSGSKMPNLMYMTTFPDMPTRDTLWKAFFEAPEWTALKAMPKYENSVSHADIIFLVPTEYSAY